nr:hypothetical protein [uncultured Sphingomonas sp.]
MENTNNHEVFGTLDPIVNAVGTIADAPQVVGKLPDERPGQRPFDYPVENTA